MSLTLDLPEFYLEFYATATVDDLKKELDQVEKELIESEEEMEKNKCIHEYCRQGFSTGVSVTEKDILLVDFFIYNEKMICPDCKYMVENASSENPILTTRMIYEYKDLIEKAILSKQKNYDKLSDIDLQEELTDTYKYRRYLEKCETNFDWCNEETPPGLGKEICENEDKSNALIFEQNFRAIKKKYENKTTLVQSDSD